MRRQIWLIGCVFAAAAIAADPLSDAELAQQRGDYMTARKLLAPLAENGDPGAQAALGSMYYEGEGVAIDHKEAFKWFRLAAESGDAVAQRRVGEMYSAGDGVTMDDREAAKWYRRAARRGDPDAQYALGMCYDKGRGVPQNDIRAHMWLNIAGSNYANQNQAFQTHQARDRLAMRMTPDRVARAEQMASECLANGYKGCR